MTNEIQSIELPNGVTLPYTEHGDKTGIPLLLLHGFAGAWQNFQPLLSLLPGSIRAIALTQRGHGSASHPSTGYHVSDFANDLNAFLNALDIEAAIVLGHSMGASVAQRFAIDYPARTLGLVLVSLRASMQDRPGLQERWDSKISKLTDPVDPAFVRSFLENTFFRPVPEDYRSASFHEALKVPARVWKQAFQAALETDLIEGLDQIRIPTLLVWGAEDETVPLADRDAISAAITAAQQIVYPGVGHSPHAEIPDRFAADLVAFIEQHIAVR